MKQKDYLLIGLIVFFGAIIAFGISRLFITGEKTIQKVEVVQPITADFPPTNDKYFNKDAFNPTLTIEIQKNENTAPFKDQKSQ